MSLHTPENSIGREVWATLPLSKFRAASEALRQRGRGGKPSRSQVEQEYASYAAKPQAQAQS